MALRANILLLPAYCQVWGFLKHREYHQLLLRRLQEGWNNWSLIVKKGKRRDTQVPHSRQGSCESRCPAASVRHLCPRKYWHLRYTMSSRLAPVPAQRAGCCEFLWALGQAGALCCWSEVPALQALPWKELQGQSFFFGFGPRMLEIRQSYTHRCQRALCRLSL